LVFLLVGILTYELIVYKGLTDTAKSIYEPIDRKLSEKRMKAVVFKDQEPFPLLVLGVDEMESVICNSLHDAQ